MTTKTLVITREKTEEQTELNNPWQVILFNDEVHSFDQVILQIQKAAGYSLEKAFELTIRVHEKGKAMIYVGSEADCEKVSAVLQQIQLIVVVEKT